MSAASNFSALSMNSAVSDFLESKVQVYQADVDYWREYQNGLRQAIKSERLAMEDYHKEMETYSTKNMSQF